MKLNTPLCRICAEPLLEVGRGKYPYNCPAKDKFPDAMIFDGCPNGHDTGWCHETEDGIYDTMGMTIAGHDKINPKYVMGG